MVSLRPTDLDRALVDVVLPQRPRQPLPRRRTRDEGVVVRLVLIARHVDLVGLAVVDEHVPAPAVPEHLEVAGVLIHVQHDPDVLLREEGLELADLRHVRDGKRAVLEERLRAARRTCQHHDRPPLREPRQRLVPLPDLVHVHRGVGEVDGDPGTCPVEALEPARRALCAAERAATARLIRRYAFFTSENTSIPHANEGTSEIPVT